MALTTDSATCPFCGQPLLDHDAVLRVEASEREYEERLEESAQRKAAALAKRLAAKELAVGEKKLKELSKQLEALKREHADELKQQRTQILADTQAEAARQAETKVRMRMRQLERQLESLKDQNEEQTRRIEHMTADERGELNEEDILAELKAMFPDDRIERRGRGRAGSDIVHEVRYESGDGYARAGVIVYECKDTATWSNGFVEQAKKARETHKTPYSVVITRAFPRGQKVLCVRDGVPIVNPARAADLASILRGAVISIHRAGVTSVGLTAKSEELYQYIASHDFRRAFDSIGDSSTKLTTLLNAERKWHERSWAGRQKVYDDIAGKTAAIDGRVRSIIEAPAETAELEKVVRLRARAAAQSKARA